MSPIMFLNLNLNIRCGNYETIEELDIKINDILPIKSSSFLSSAEFDKNLELINQTDSSSCIENHNLDMNITINEDLPTSNEDLKEYLEFLDRITWPTNNVINDTNIDADYNDNLVNDRFDEYVKELYNHLKTFIKKNVSGNQFITFIQRLDMIKKTINLIKDHDEELFTAEIDIDLTFIIKNLKLKYSNLLVLNNKIYKSMSKDLDRMIKEVQINNFEKHKILQKKIEKMQNQNLIEFVKMYKYIKTFPELLTLGYVSTQGCLYKVTYTLRLLNLFLAQNQKGLEENRRFIMFLLQKAFSHTPRRNLDIISTLGFQKSNSFDISQFYFFSWEFGYGQRRKIKKLINHKKNIKFYFFEDDRIHYDIVLRLFLFQHLIYLKYKTVNTTEFENFKAFTNSVLSKKACYKIQFYEFINMIEFD